MPRKFIDKKTAQHFTLVHRPQHDPLIHDDAAPQVLLNPTAGSGGASSSSSSSSTKVKHLDDLASEFGSDSGVRKNEGEAANYGIFFDDTDYDYMQHLREPGGGGAGNVVFVPARNKEKEKQKKKPLEVQLRESSVGDSAGSLAEPAVPPPKNLSKLAYQIQQSVPDYIAGFQPDMDPRLREVLEALEDEAYVDDGDDDIFQALAEDGKEVTEREFEDSYRDEEWDDHDDDDDDGWESDRTVKPAEKPEELSGGPGPSPQSDEGRIAEGPADGSAPDQPSQDWMEQFKKFKKDQQPGRKPAMPDRSEVPSSLVSTSTAGGRRKKRKGALTCPSTYSMTSSSLVRTDQLTILDARFDKIEEEYNRDEDDEDDGASSVSGLSSISTTSSVTGSMRTDFDNILDDFLAENPAVQRNRGKKGKWSRSKNTIHNGLAQFDEFRRELGPVSVPSKV